MARARLAFKQTDTRALRAASVAGQPVQRFEIDRERKIGPLPVHRLRAGDERKRHHPSVKPTRHDARDRPAPAPRRQDCQRNWPLVLTRPQAAEMCRISIQTFDVWVRKGILPHAIPGTRRWSRVSIEQALAGGAVSAEVAISSAGGAVSAEVAISSPFEQWKRARAH
jgi:hypothetical protein